MPRINAHGHRPAFPNITQALDPSTRPSAAPIHHLTGASSSATAFEVGALAGGASLELAMKIRELGIIYGEIIQIHDDLDDTLAVPAKPDWNAGRVSLPILFAQVVDHPARSRFEELRPHACEQVAALEEAQQILIDCGAVSYCIHQLLERTKSARGLISALPFEQRDVLNAIFEDVIQPVLGLLDETGTTP